MADTGAVVLKGVIAALVADGGVSAAVGARVYSDVPQGEVFPYVLVEIQSGPFAANDFSGQIHTVRVHCYSRGASKGQALLVRSAVHAALDRNESAIALDSGSLVKCEYTGVGYVLAEDQGKTWDATGEFELWVM